MKTRAQKREEAAVRQAEYEKLSTEQKLARLDSKGYVAAKQRLKLLTNFKAPTQEAK